VWHILSDGDFELVLANAAHVKNVPGRKTDVNDATWLADLMAHGSIRASVACPERSRRIPEEPTQQMRDLHLQHLDAVNADITRIDKEVEGNLEPFRVACEMLNTTPA